MVFAKDYSPHRVRITPRLLEQTYAAGKVYHVRPPSGQHRGMPTHEEVGAEPELWLRSRLREYGRRVARCDQFQK